MGRDKAMLTLGGKTFLRRAVETGRAVAEEVVLLGHREELEGADRVIPDLHPGCGLVGGMETALRDLAAHPGREWACFLPVDMPFLPVGLYAALIRGWLEESAAGLRVAYAEVDGVPQPLLSLLHVSAKDYLEVAVGTGHLKVTAVLRNTAKELCTSVGDRLNSFHTKVQTLAFVPGRVPGSEQEQTAPRFPWTPTAQQLAARHLWFANFNTPQELEEGERFLKDSASV
jgi:molybdenum cofactor guanylyltransferase